MRLFRGRTRREIDALRTEVARQRDELDRRADSDGGGEQEHDRRRFLTSGVAAVAAGLTGAVLGADTAGATTGAMQFGAVNAADTDTTSLTSTSTNTTLYVQNTEPLGSGIHVQTSGSPPSQFALWAESINNGGTAIRGQSNGNGGGFDGAGVEAVCGGGFGVGLRTSGGRAQAILVPRSGLAGAPVAGGATHQRGELYVDSAADLYYCTVGGDPGTWTKLNNQAGVSGLAVGVTTSNGDPGEQTVLNGSTADPGEAMLLVEQAGAATDLFALRGNLNTESSNGAGVIGTVGPNTNTQGFGVYGLHQDHGTAVRGATDGGIGVSGSATGGTGVAGHSTFGVGVQASSESNAGLLVIDNAVAIPPTTGEWTAGAFVVTGGHVWYCYLGGTGSASKWVRLSSSFVPLASPVRIYNTKAANGPAFSPNQERDVPLTNGATIPHSASSVLVNLACNAPAAAGFLAMWKSGPWPGHSNLNFVTGAAASNNATSAVVAGAPSTARVRASTTTHVIVDVLGYYL